MDNELLISILRGGQKRSPTLAGLETAATLGTGALGYGAGAGLGLVDLLRGKGFERARKTAGEVSSALTYMPRSEEGQELVQGVGSALAPAAKVSEKADELVTGATGVPMLGMAAGVIADPLNFIPGGKGAHGAERAATRAARTGAEKLTFEAAEKAARAGAEKPVFVYRPQHPKANANGMVLAEVASVPHGRRAVDPVEVKRAERIRLIDEQLASAKGKKRIAELTDERDRLVHADEGALDLPYTGKELDKVATSGRIVFKPDEAAATAKALRKQPVEEGAAPAAKKRNAVGTIPWDEMSLPEAIRAARNRKHLIRRDGGEGGYIGAPQGATETPAALGAMRNRIDKAVEKGAFGADWYERARAAISEMSDTPAMADTLSQALALYSPQSTPDSNAAFALKQLSDAALRGPDATAKTVYRTGQQSEKLAAILRGEKKFIGANGKERSTKLGPKAGIYEQHINPNKAEEAQVRGVNDLWQGRVFGYNRDSGTQAGFGGSQHSFMTGENLLAALRAKEKGLLPQVAEPNVGTVQAASWVGQRYQQLLDKQAARAKKAKQLGKKFKPVPDEELRRRAGMSYDTVLDKYTGNETHEYVPGRVTGHGEGAPDLPLDKRRELTDELRATVTDENGRDQYYRAVGLPQRPTTRGLGEFTEELPSGATVTDYNPNVTARPMVTHKGSKALADSSESIMSTVNALRSVVDAQAAGAWNAPKMAGGGHNAARVRFPKPLDEASTKQLYGEAKRSGLNLIDNGDGSFTLTGSEGEGFGNMNATDFGKRLKLLKDQLTGARVDRAGYVGDYSPVAWGEEGAGTATSQMLGRMDPRLDAKFDEAAALRGGIGRRNAVEAQAFERLGVGAPRLDLQKLRTYIAENGVGALRRLYSEGGIDALKKAGLPVALGVAYLGGELGSDADLQ